MKDPYEPNWVREDRRPTIVVDNDLKEATFVAQVGDKPSLWGDVSAIDLLNFPTQRGPNKLSTDLGLLFAASGDLRNAVRSLLSLPEQYSGTYTVVINDNHSTVVVRNILLLLVAYQFREDQAVLLMIHLWHSAFLPKCMVEALQKTILPRIDQVYSKIKDKTSNFAQGETYKVGNKSTLRILLSKEDWLRLKEALTGPEGLTASMGGQVRQATTLNPARADALNFELFLRRPARRAAWRTFCEDGVLLPFGSSRASFDTPNP
jgi:hypothetical protein